MYTVSTTDQALEALDSRFDPGRGVPPMALLHGLERDGGPWQARGVRVYEAKGWPTRDGGQGRAWES